MNLKHEGITVILVLLLISAGLEGCTMYQFFDPQ